MNPRNKLSLLDRRILNRLQEDIPFVKRPWESIAAELKISEGLLLKRIAVLKRQGIIRRIAAVFTPGKVDFVSTLVGARVAPAQIEKIARKINSYLEVTHNYKRDAEYNLWFTLVAKNAERIKQILGQLKKYRGIEQLSEFPTKRLFKINVKFSA